MIDQVGLCWVKHHVETPKEPRHHLFRPCYAKAQVEQGEFGQEGDILTRLGRMRIITTKATDKLPSVAQPRG